MQLFAEIFYDPFLYDLEISVFSTDASKVRSRLSDPNRFYESHLDWTLYKGSKQLFMELESGTYELKIVQKLPPIADLDLVNFNVDCVQFQMQVLYAKYIDK